MSGEATNYLTFVAALRQRLTVELGLSYDTIDALMGWAPTYTTKFLAPEPIPTPRVNGKRTSTFRTLSPVAFDGLLRLACWKINFVQDEKALVWLQRQRDFVPRKRPVRNDVGPACIVRRITRENMSFMGRLSGEARMRKIPPAKRTRLARKAAKARWARPRMVEQSPGKPPRGGQPSAAARAPGTSAAASPGSRAPALQPRSAGTAAATTRAPRR